MFTPIRDNAAASVAATVMLALALGSGSELLQPLAIAGVARPAVYALARR